MYFLGLLWDGAVRSMQPQNTSTQGLPPSSFAVSCCDSHNCGDCPADPSCGDVCFVRGSLEVPGAGVSQGAHPRSHLWALPLWDPCVQQGWREAAEVSCSLSFRNLLEVSSCLCGSDGSSRGGGGEGIL